ncbi:DUF2505 domain-containing protein [Nocardioides hankookensis]|uniref:DUF2505 domain-containing protein n=1 Tax=Nocardioides hankookensis TaxID=443157 RepID=A0ABW1LQ93_9ACTN
MKFRHELTYDASPAEVFAMLADPAFREAGCAAADVVSADVTVERVGDGFTLTVERVDRTDGLPSFARKFAGDTTRSIQREEWADATSGTLVIEAPGKPSEVQGTITLEPDGAATREIIELDLKIKVPLIGGKLEKLLAEQVTAGIEAEQQAGIAYLKEH